MHRESSPLVHDVLDELAASDAVRRLHDRDASLWGMDEDTPDGPGERLGWLDSAAPPEDWQPRLDDLARSCRASGLGRVVLCGMGGSAFAPTVLATAIDPGGAGLRLTMLDSTHPDAVRDTLGVTLEDTLVVVASKSGTTIETRAMGDYAAERVPDASHLVAVTDPGTVLEDHALREGFRAVFLNPADIGGRFSGLSLFGMVPVAATGMETAPLLARVAAAARRVDPSVPLADNPAARLAAFAVAHAREGRDKLTLLIDPRLASFGPWVEQLVAESTGKGGHGIVPVINEPTGTPGEYGPDRAFVEIRLGGEPVEGAEALADAGLPVLVTDLAEPTDVAGAMFEWMVATALAGALLGINPFDQPDVGAAKEATATVLAEIAGGMALPEPEDGRIIDAVAQAGPGDYFAVEAYLPPTTAAWQGLQKLQGALRQATGCAVTANFGPRYLHSTGQLHKGGPNTCVVVHLVDDPSDEPVPGKGYGFATLIRAQATGDLRALRGRGRRVVQARARTGDLAKLAEAARTAGA